MARKYDRIIRFYSSWFADLMDDDKGFTDSERWQIVMAMASAQMLEDMRPLDALPAEIRRGLQMATLKEQTYRMLERSERMRSRGAAGGNKAQGNVSAERQAELEAIREARRQAEAEEWERQRAASVSYDEYLAMKKKGEI